MISDVIRYKPNCNCHMSILTDMKISLSVHKLS